MTGESRHENHLRDQKSPYLKQHAMNPVDWYPWGAEALKRARAEDKPMLISIGYSSCHWCHVMERESFEDDETARIMNDNFINIKVDREERPDLDSLYIKAVQAMTGHAGWPLTVFATPGGAPFYGGSYFPPEDRYGMPSFKKVLLAVSIAYRKNKRKVGLVTADVERVLSSAQAVPPMELRTEVADIAFDAARLFFDPVNGGFGRNTKFPHAMFQRFLLLYHRRTGRDEALSMVRKTLSSMALGGVYDHLGGGFHRYSVDERWDVPHFEKMLYDNALLAELYIMAYEATGKAFYKDVAMETISWMMREMTGEMGGFYASEDADVDGEEGAYYVWGAEEVREALGERAQAFMEYFSITREGNYEGRNTLRIKRPVGAEEDAIPIEMKRLKTELFAARSARKPPEKDRKIIASWNGLALGALSLASKSFNRRDFGDEARRSARFMLSTLRDGGGRLKRYFLDGGAEVKGMLEDYALLAGGLAAMSENLGEDEWLDEAERLTGRMVELFYDEGSERFYDTGSDQDRLFVRERDLYDNDIPSGNSAAASVLLKVGRARKNREYVALSERILGSIEGMTAEPISYGNFLAALEEFFRGEGGAPH